MHVISNIALISINETVIVQLISFLIFLFIINRVMIAPLRGVMAERQQHLDGIRQDIEDAEKEMARLHHQQREQEAEVRREAAKLREKLEVEGNREATAILQGAEKEIAGLRAVAEQEIAAKLGAARRLIEAEAEVLAVHIMEKVLERSLKA